MGLLSGFSVFIAVLQISGVLFGLSRLTYDGELTNDPYFNEDYSKIAVPIIIVTYIKLLIAAGLLLKGILDKRPGYFLYWLIYNGFIVCVATIGIIFLYESQQIAMLDESPHLFIAALVLYWIKWVVVFAHYKEVQKERSFGDLLNPYSKFTDENAHTILIKS